MERYITKEERRRLCLLDAMEEAGVDNWDGDYHDIYRSYLEEEGLLED